MLKARFALVFLMFWLVDSSANVKVQQREDFLTAEVMLDEGEIERYFLIKPKLKGYPLDFYLDYQYLSKNLDKSAQIQQFIKAHKNSGYAYKLRRKWHSYLYKSKQWSAFVKSYKPTKNLSRQCQYQWARYQVGYKKNALKAVQKIWVIGRSLPKVCDPLLARFVQSKFLTQQLIFQRYKNAIKARELKLAAYLYEKISTNSVKNKAKEWLKIAENTQLSKNAAMFKKGSFKGQSELFIYAVKRLINQDINSGIVVWESNQQKGGLSEAQKYRVNRKIGLQLAFNKSKKAYAKLIPLNSKKDTTLREWTVRAALIEGNWKHVQHALDQLTTTEKASSRWQYWQARVFYELGQAEQADAIFVKLAESRGFYSFIAADKMKLSYSLRDKPIKASKEQQEQLLQTRDFSIISEFKALGKEKLARLYWKNTIGQLNNTELLIGAKVAQQWGWNKLAILSVAEAKNWGDISLRFPLEYENSVAQNAIDNTLPASIIYGLIRRESMFDPLAESPVGALGLMQIMPATGKRIVKDLNHRWRTKSVLLNAEKNLKYGSFYYKQMLDTFSGNYALAAAAYNAGPHRVKRWLKFDGTLASDIWIETIPYKETRGYVAAVLTYAIIYQQRLPEKNTLISEFLQDISAAALNTKLALAENN